MECKEKIKVANERLWMLEAENASIVKNMFILDEDSFENALTQVQLFNSRWTVNLEGMDYLNIVKETILVEPYTEVRGECVGPYEVVE